MKKILITIAILMAIGATASAINYNQILIDIYNRRPDLQKAFPGSPYGNTKLEDWAKKYGWKENTDLYEYYPEKEIVQKIVDIQTSAKIKNLENKIKELESRQPTSTTNTIEKIIERVEVPAVPTEPTGKWRICCGYETGTFNCSDEVQISGCKIGQYKNAYQFKVYFQEYK